MRVASARCRERFCICRPTQLTLNLTFVQSQAYYFIKIVVRFALKSDASFPDNLTGCLARRRFGLTAGGRFSVNAASRIHQVDSQRFMVGSVILLDIKAPQLLIVVAVLVTVRVSVVTVDRPDTIRIGVTIIVSHHPCV